MSLANARNKRPTLIYTPRDQLNNDQKFAIDSTVKALKSCSRRVNHAISTFRDELQLLERLYYKGKNQHRSALFWRRVCETRRYGSRLTKLDLPSVLQDLYKSFFGEEAKTNSKLLKGSWNHHPDIKTIQYTLDQISACLKLLEATKRVLMNAYTIFTTSMQNGYFLQLIAVLVAMASRMDLLVTELQDGLYQGERGLKGLLDILDPSRKSPTFRNKVTPLANSGRASVQEDLELLEDIGSSVQVSTVAIRPTLALILPTQPRPSVDLDEEPTINFDLSNILSADMKGPIKGKSHSFPLIPTFYIVFISTAAENKTPSTQGNPAKTYPPDLESTKLSAAAKPKKKKKKNEIDAIFGL